MLRELWEALGGNPLRRESFAFLQHEQPLAFAHRGGMKVWPENTLYAFEQAAAAGIDGLEMDVHLTRDGHLVVCHDPTLDRTTDGSGVIKEMSLEEVQRYDAGYCWTNNGGASYPFRGMGIRVPSLREVFRALPQIRYIIDNKPRHPEMALKLAELAVECGVEANVCLASFYSENVKAIRRAHPKICTSCAEKEVHAFGLSVFTPLQYFYRPPAPCFQVPPRHGKLEVISPRFMRLANRKGMDVHAWTVNDPEEMRRLFKLGVRAIISDYPEVVVEAASAFKRG